MYGQLFLFDIHNVFGKNRFDIPYLLLMVNIASLNSNSTHHYSDIVLLNDEVLQGHLR